MRKPKEAENGKKKKRKLKTEALTLELELLKKIVELVKNNLFSVCFYLYFKCFCVG